MKNGNINKNPGSFKKKSRKPQKHIQERNLFYGRIYTPEKSFFSSSFHIQNSSTAVCCFSINNELVKQLKPDTVKHI